jgi:5-methylcytosine-specific restriction enzyme subunit McrC
MRTTQRIQVFEHHTLYYGREYDGVKFQKKHFDALAKLNSFHDNKYFTLVHKGVKFSQYVGVIRVDELNIEVLPKIDSVRSDDEAVWQGVLIEMLKQTKKLKVQKVGQAHVNKQSIHLLDIYFDWFLREVQDLYRKGLIKKYYKESKNVKALKGKLEFAEHLNKNLIHKERFFTSHQIYNKDHTLHQILHQALSVIELVSKGTYLYSKCKEVQINFPEVSSIKCSETTFSKLLFNRKNKPYETAIEIARLIILNFAPNISSGSENMLALLFDMNTLWEEYVLLKLKEATRDLDIEVKGQNRKQFWNGSTIRPDIVIIQGEKTCIIDTKWKNNKDNKPNTNDLRQMYVYNEYWKGENALLLYPSASKDFILNKYFESPSIHSCGIAKVNVFDVFNNLDPLIGHRILDTLLENDLLTNDKKVISV